MSVPFDQTIGCHNDDRGADCRRTTGGPNFFIPMGKTHSGAESVGKHKTSMLQDVEAGKPMEIESMLGAVIELAEVTGIQTPTPEGYLRLRELTQKNIESRKNHNQRDIERIKLNIFYKQVAKNKVTGFSVIEVLDIINYLI
ncbi:MAG: hypothetical protein Ct9H300mP28_00530 [Pseudomonadota bacterium]|nr:MAG: hypothetical protein Ct9H300mP28_00530 [Pseudomonadota bacterium]